LHFGPNWAALLAENNQSCEHDITKSASSRYASQDDLMTRCNTSNPVRPDDGPSTKTQRLSAMAEHLRVDSESGAYRRNKRTSKTELFNGYRSLSKPANLEKWRLRITTCTS
jgi:hypothetical protein